MELECSFHKEMHLLEVKYEQMKADLEKKRKAVILGDYEPTEEESTWTYDCVDEDEDEDEEQGGGDAKIEQVDETKKEAKSEPMESSVEMKGIPEFWLTIFKSSPPLDQTIEDHDEPILEHLRDVRCKLAPDADNMAFTLEFEFGANDYFENDILTKTYHLSNKLDEDDPLGYEGPEIIRCTGCQIKWKKDMNVTEKIVKKKQKHKGTGTVRTVEKKILNDSFFNFFNPPIVQEDEELDEDTEALLDSDFHIGSIIKDRLCTRAVLYFTGEAQAMEREDDEDYDGMGEDEDDEDEDYQPADGEKPECKQQWREKKRERV